MKLNSNLYRDRAVLALHRLVGDDATPVERISGLAAAIRLVDLDLILAAGDHEQPLDFTRLKPLAARHGCNVLATYVDPLLSGHVFILDAVLWQGGVAETYPERRLWLGDGQPFTLVSGQGTGPALTLSATGLAFADTPPFTDTLSRNIGVASGQALLHRLIYAGTPFATPIAAHRGR